MRVNTEQQQEDQGRKQTAESNDSTINHHQYQQHSNTSQSTTTFNQQISHCWMECEKSQNGVVVAVAPPQAEGTWQGKATVHGTRTHGAMVHGAWQCNNCWCRDPLAAPPFAHATQQFVRQTQLTIDCLDILSRTCNGLLLSFEMLNGITCNIFGLD